MSAVALGAARSHTTVLSLRPPAQVELIIRNNTVRRDAERAVETKILQISVRLFLSKKKETKSFRMNMFCLTFTGFQVLLEHKSL